MLDKLPKRFLSILLLAVGAALLAACGGGASDEPIKVGAIFDLTGATSDVGGTYSEGVKGYVDWRNANGGIGGRQIELISADYAYAVDQAEQLYSQYVNQDEVVVFSGWGTGDTEALRGRIGDDQVPFVSASYSAALRDPAEAPYNFLVGTTYSDQFILALERAAAEGATTVALFHHDSPFGLSPLEDGRAYAAENGMEILPFPMGATDYTAELTQAQEAGVTHIVIQNVSSPAATLIKNVRDLGMDMTVMCLNWCTNEVLIELGGDAVEGVVGVNPFTFPSSGVEGLAVIDEYLQSQGSSLEEKGGLYVAGWTTMDVLMQGVENVIDSGEELNGPNIKAALEGLNNYSTGGITEPITFTADDHAGNKSVQFFEVQGGEWVAITDRVSIN